MGLEKCHFGSFVIHYLQRQIEQQRLLELSFFKIISMTSLSVSHFRKDQEFWIHPSIPISLRNIKTIISLEYEYSEDWLISASYKAIEMDGILTYICHWWARRRSRLSFISMKTEPNVNNWDKTEIKSSIFVYLHGHIYSAAYICSTEVNIVDELFNRIFHGTAVSFHVPPKCPSEV